MPDIRQVRVFTIEPKPNRGSHIVIAWQNQYKHALSPLGLFCLESGVLISADLWYMYFLKDGRLRLMIHGGIVK